MGLSPPDKQQSLWDATDPNFIMPGTEKSQLHQDFTVVLYSPNSKKGGRRIGEDIQTMERLVSCSLQETPLHSCYANASHGADDNLGVNLSNHF